MMVHAARDAGDNFDGDRGGIYAGIPADNPTPKREYMCCENSKCRLYHLPFRIPTVPLTLADPLLVAAVNRLEEEDRRAREKWKVEADLVHQQARRDFQEWLEKEKGFGRPLSSKEASSIG